MKSSAIWPVVILAMAATACEPAEQEKAPQKPGVCGRAEGTPKELAVDLGGGVKMEMVLVPAGQFSRGDDNGFANEKPEHTVRISQPFYLGKCEVTQEQWEAVMGDHPSGFEAPKHPVEQVSWYDCQIFFDRW